MSVRELPVELREKAKKDLNEDENRIKEDVGRIKDWLGKQTYINARLDDQLILTFLRNCKFSLEKTKTKLETFYTMKTMLPEFFKNRDPLNSSIQEILKLGVFLPLIHHKSVDHPSYVIVRTGAYDPLKYSFVQIIKTNLLLVDIGLLENDYAAVNGIHVILDMKGLTMAHIPNPVVMKKTMMCLQDGYPHRIKCVDFINIPPYFETIFKMVAPLLNDKIKKRVNIFGPDNMEKFYKKIPKHIIPTDFGGTGDSMSLILERCKTKLETYRNWFIEDEKYGTDESHRPGKPKTVDEYFGVEGSFRKLNVD